MYGLCYWADISARGFGTEMRGNNQVSTPYLLIPSGKKAYARIIGHQGNVGWYIADKNGYVLDQGVVHGDQTATPSIVVANDTNVLLTLVCNSLDTVCIARGFISKGPIRHSVVPTNF